MKDSPSVVIFLHQSLFGITRQCEWCGTPINPKGKMIETMWIISVEVIYKFYHVHCFRKAAKDGGWKIGLSI